MRYIDDILMVADSEAALNDGITYSEAQLSTFGFSLYQPVPESDKASKGGCANALSFLGCTLQPNRCVPSRRSVAKLIREISETISSSKKAMDNFIVRSNGFDFKQSRSHVLYKLSKKVYGWQKSFAFCTESQVFTDIDRDISKKVSDYEHWVSRKTRDVPPEKLMAIVGIPSMRRLFEATKAQREQKTRATGGHKCAGSLKAATSAIQAASDHTFP